MKIAVLGLGQRGLGYITILYYFHHEVEIVAIADLNHDRADQVAKKFHIANKYYSDKELFASPVTADAIIIATQDRDHYGHSLEAIQKGYKNILVEKPVSPSIDECEDLLNKANEAGVKIVVCHVLRYAKYYRKIKDIIESGKIGKVITINHMENVGYFHFAHSYVRGAWHNSNTASPFLLAKCCHDFDLLHWFMNEKCISISSYGELSYFKKDSMPDGASNRCFNCPIKNCKYNAEYLYLTAPLRYSTFLKYQSRIVTGKSGSTKEEIREALKNGDYGRCVYQMDNNVPDHQVVNMVFADGATASHTVTAFSDKFYRRTIVSGTNGEISGNDYDGILRVRIYNGKHYTIHTKLFKGLGHIDGDLGLIKYWVDLLEGKLENTENITYLKDTIPSHRMVLTAEKSRLENGKTLDVNE